MVIMFEDRETGVQAGINDEGVLFLSNGRSGYNLPDTPRNRVYIKRDFEKMTGKKMVPDRI